MSVKLERNPKGEVTLLGHEATPGFRPWLYAALAAGVIYLVLAFSGLV